MEKWKTDKVALENQCKDVIAKEKENSQKNSEIHNIAKRKLDEMEHTTIWSNTASAYRRDTPRSTIPVTSACRIS